MKELLELSKRFEGYGKYDLRIQHKGSVKAGTRRAIFTFNAHNETAEYELKYSDAPEDLLSLLRKHQQYTRAQPATKIESARQARRKWEGEIKSFLKPLTHIVIYHALVPKGTLAVMKGPEHYYEAHAVSNPKQAPETLTAQTYSGKITVKKISSFTVPRDLLGKMQSKRPFKIDDVEIHPVGQMQYALVKNIAHRDTNRPKDWNATHSTETPRLGLLVEDRCLNHLLKEEKPNGIYVHAESKSGARQLERLGFEQYSTVSPQEFHQAIKDGIKSRIPERE